MSSSFSSAASASSESCYGDWEPLSDREEPEPCAGNGEDDTAAAQSRFNEELRRLTASYNAKYCQLRDWQQAGRRGTPEYRRLKRKLMKLQTVIHARVEQEQHDSHSQTSSASSPAFSCDVPCASSSADSQSDSDSESDSASDAEEAQTEQSQKPRECIATSKTCEQGSETPSRSAAAPVSAPLCMPAASSSCEKEEKCEKQSRSESKKPRSSHKKKSKKHKEGSKKSKKEKKHKRSQKEDKAPKERKSSGKKSSSKRERAEEKQVATASSSSSKAVTRRNSKHACSLAGLVLGKVYGLLHHEICFGA